MAYTGKTNWQLNEIVKPEDMNRIEQGVIDAHENLLTHNKSADAHKNRFDEFVKGVTGSNATLTITKGNGTTSTVTVNNVANATNATNASKATQDSTGQQISSTYIKGLSVSGKTITYTKGNNTTGTITTQDTTYNFGGTTFYSGNQNTAEHNANNCLKNGHYYYTSNGPSTSIGASTIDGGLYTQSYSDEWVGQIAQDYRNGRLFVRGKNDGTWTSWLALLDSSNYNNYAPTKTGGGASGTWGINISGNADTATSATNATTAQVANKVNFTIGDEIVFNRNGQNDGGDVWLGYRNEGATNPITTYRFGDGLAHGGLANIRAKTFVGNLSGNADTATKATQDSAGQQINTTYIKGLSISGNTITYTKGNGGTGSITVPTGAGAKVYVTETYQNGTSWYRKYSDGWIEQGGRFICSSTGNATITLIKAMSNSNYNVTISKGDPTGENFFNNLLTGRHFQASNYKTTSFQTFLEKDASSPSLATCVWSVRGY